MEGKKKLSYRCPDCGNEWQRWKDITDRKRSSWCSTCKQMVTPFQTEKPQITQGVVKTRKPKPLWALALAIGLTLSGSAFAQQRGFIQGYGPRMPPMMQQRPPQPNWNALNMRPNPLACRTFQCSYRQSPISGHCYKQQCVR